MAILLLAACGVKKTAVPAEAEKASAPIHSPITDSLAQAGTAVDSLAFLGDLVNDSSIHINWAYGIPFIIDDSVPMLLPPIDKNPQGYVSSRDFTQHEPEIRYIIHSEIESTQLILIDSLLWLNKCINDIYYFLQKETKEVPLGHRWNYILSVCPIKNNETIIVFKISLSPYWSCLCKPIAYEQEVCYCYDINGTLLAQYLTKESHCRYGTGAKKVSRFAQYIKNSSLMFHDSHPCIKLLALGICNVVNEDCCARY